MLLPLDNFISKATDVFLGSQQPNYLALTNQVQKKLGPLRTIHNSLASWYPPDLKAANPALSTRTIVDWPVTAAAIWLHRSCSTGGCPWVAGMELSVASQTFRNKPAALCFAAAADAGAGAERGWLPRGPGGWRLGWVAAQ